MNLIPHEENQPNTNTLDLFAPTNRFTVASRLHGRLHRWSLQVRRYWWLPVVITPLVLGLVYWLTALSGPTYESQARMWVTGKINVSESWSYTEELVNFLGTQAALLESPAIQSRALAKLRAESGSLSDLTSASSRKLPKILLGARALWRKLVASDAPSDTNAPPSIPFQIKVWEGAKSSTLELRCTGATPKSTQRFLNCVMAEYLSFKRESRDQASTQAFHSLDAEAARLKSELAAAQQKLQGFQASNNVVILQQQGSGAETYLATLNRQLATLRTEQKLLDSLKPEQWVEVSSPAGANPGSGDEATARQLLAGLAQSQATLFQADQQVRLLMAQRDELSRFLRPAHPKIIKLNQDIATQQKIVQVARDEAAKQLSLRRQAVEAQIHNLEAASEEWNAKAIETGVRMAEYNQLQQNGQRLQNAYDKTFGLIQTLDVEHRVEQENVGILDPASVAKPSHRMLINLVIAGVLSLLLYFGLLYGIELFQDDFASYTELSEQLTETVLGQIPAIGLKTPKGRLSMQFLDKQRFEFLESFRNIRSSLLFMSNGSTRPKTILITSSVPTEGKSTIALYLAATMAMGGSRVLLIDSDMRRATLHKFFGARSGPGLAEILNCEIPAASAFVSCDLENLSLLPAGVPQRNPGELILHAERECLTDQLRSQFDYILIDSPPLLATDDAATLAPKVDGVLLVVRSAFTSARMTRRALELLHLRQAHVLGLVLNRVVSSAYEGHYYESYGGDYRWRPQPPRRAQVPEPKNAESSLGG